MSAPVSKDAAVAFPVHELIAQRYSTLAFDERPLAPGMLGSLFEAARWAPSSYNAQPWRFLVGERQRDPEGWARIAGLLIEGNSWAKRAPVLTLVVTQLELEFNGKPNRHAWHDVGLAVENLVLQAQAFGLGTRQMGGFDVERARTELAIPAGFEPVAVIAIGHPASPDVLDEPLRARERAPRARKSLGEIVSGARWGAAATALDA